MNRRAAARVHPEGLTVPYHRTHGVVLRCTDYSESSQVAAISTPDLGQIHVLAKGSRRPRRDGRGPLDQLDHYDLVIARRAPGQLHILAEWHLCENFPGIRRGLDGIWIASYAVEIVLRATSENPDDGPLCDDLLALLRKLDVAPARRQRGSERGPERGRKVGDNVHVALCTFLARALRTLGCAPVAEKCAQCGGSLARSVLYPPQAGEPQGRGKGHTRFSPASGGALCGDCGVNDSNAFPISRGSLVIMSKLSQGGNAGASLRINTLQAAEIRRAFNEQIQYHLGKALKTERFLIGI